MLSGDPSCVCGFVVLLLSIVTLRPCDGIAGIALFVRGGGRVHNVLVAGAIKRDAPVSC
jgi:hypothetical protein